MRVQLVLPYTPCGHFRFLILWRAAPSGGIGSEARDRASSEARDRIGSEVRDCTGSEARGRTGSEELDLTQDSPRLHPPLTFPASTPPPPTTRPDPGLSPPPPTTHVLRGRPRLTQTRLRPDPPPPNPPPPLSFRKAQRCRSWWIEALPSLCRGASRLSLRLCERERESERVSE